MPKNYTNVKIKIKTTTTITPEDYPYYEPFDYEYEEDIYKKVFNISTRINLTLQILTVIFNFLHLIILLRKDLRSFAIYIFMIGVCISDILTNSLDFINAAGEISWIPILFAGSGEMSCLRDDYSKVNVGAQAVATMLDISRRLSVWLAIMMAIMRCLSVLFPTSQKVQNLSKAKGALVTLGLCVLFWVIFNTWHFAFYRIFWLPDNASPFCQSMFKSSITPRYVLGAPALLKESMLDWGFIEVVMKFAATICYPILTILLIVTLRNIKKQRQDISKKGSDSPDHTTKLILFMTVTFMLSEGLAGVQALLLYNVNEIMEQDEDMGMLVNTTQYPVGVLRTVNALSHPFVCFLMSTQYRNAVRGIFGKKKTKKLDVTRSTTNIRSRTTAFSTVSS